MPGPRDYPRSTRRHIAQGLVNPNHPERLTGEGERVAQERYDGEDQDDRYDVGDHGWDPGDNFDW